MRLAHHEIGIQNYLLFIIFGCGKSDKNRQTKKFSRYFESDWTIKNDMPHYGLKEHAEVDVVNGLFLSTNITPHHSDSTYLPYATILQSAYRSEDQGGLADIGYA